MKRIILILFLLTGALGLVKAQEKTAVGIMGFTYVQGAADPQDVTTIQESVTNAFVKTKRFNIVDRSKMDALRAERDLQKSEDFIDGSVIAQGVSLGASYLIAGHVISAQATPMSVTDQYGRVTTTYKAKMVISLKVIDVASGQVITSTTIEPKSGSLVLGALGMAAYSPEAAIAKSLKDIEGDIDKFIGLNFPQAFSIAEIQAKDENGGATKVLIAGGSAFGLAKGDALKVVELVSLEVDGKTLQRKKEIGTLKISKVEDENFSICSVSAGGIEINSKFEAKAKIQIITKD